MSVLAKRSFSAPANGFARAVAAAAVDPSVQSIDAARRVLIAAGQLEQGLLDAGAAAGTIAREATRAAAACFVALHAGELSSAAEHRQQLRRRLCDVVAGTAGAEVEVRVPEGFAWYALYPDSYLVTARSWVRESWSASCDGGARRVLVIGLRSIGTTLAAVVAEVLRRSGVKVACTSVRTVGHPFARQAELPEGVRPGDHNLIVDEGPGLSGSSMAAVAAALERGGAARSSITLFPGHGRGPGSEAAQAGRRWWSEVEVRSIDLTATLIGATPLLEVLRGECSRWLGSGCTAPRPLGVDDWMRRTDLSVLPRSAAPALETPKLLVCGAEGRAAVLRFAGTAPLDATLETGEGRLVRRLDRLADRGSTVRPFGAVHGWVAVPWVDGSRLTRRDATASFIAGTLAPHLVAAASEPIGVDLITRGAERIVSAVMALAAFSHDARWREILGRAAEHVARPDVGPILAAGDGRLAPHEWIRDGTGRILKLDAGGHDADHTWVGRQPVAWDIAGAEIEWELGSVQSELLRGAVEGANGGRPDALTMAFYGAGYCAFRAGAARHCALIPGAAGPSGAAEWYERRLVESLVRLEQEL
jgi:hypothetical protein